MKSWFAGTTGWQATLPSSTMVLDSLWLTTGIKVFRDDSHRGGAGTGIGPE